MPVIAAVFPETLYFNVTIDGKGFPFALHGKMQHGMNGARSFTCTVAGKEALEMCRLGAIVEVNWGRGNLENLIDDKTFTGIIKDLKPKANMSTFTALDYTTFLAESQYVYYKSEDYIGQDLYFAAANECNYKGIDVTRLVQGSGLFITKDMDLFGWKTRKEFIDACFNEMKILVSATSHPTNTIRQWQYAIREGKKMDFFLPDPDRTVNFPYITLSEVKGNILDEAIVSNIDTTRIVNAITVASSKDETIYAQIEDFGSQDKYGVIGKFLSYPSTDKNELEGVAYKVLSRFKEPTVSYTVSLNNQDSLDIGDLIEIDVPALPKATIKTVVGYEVSFGDSLTTRYQIGQPKVSIKEYIDLLKEPIDR